MGPTNDYETHVQTALAQVPRPWPSRRTLHGSFDAGWYQHSLSSCKIDCFTVLSSHLTCRPYGGVPVLVPAASFHGDTSGGDAKCRLFSQAAQIVDLL